MKIALFGVAIILLTISRLQALEEGVYLISCTEISENRADGVKPCRGFLLTVSKDGTATLAFSSYGESLKIQELSIIEQGYRGNSNFLLYAKFDEDPETDSSASSILTLFFDGENGKGSEVGAVRPKFLLATIGKVTQAEQAMPPKSDRAGG